MKTAIIGLGVIGNVHIEILLDRGAEVVAICDIDESKLKKFPSIKGYTDYKEMIEVEKPDVVHICTPHYLHTEMIIYALNKNLNVFCEKPLCINKQDFSKILDAEKNSKGQLGVCFQNRYLTKNSFVKEYLKDKKIVGATGFFAWDRTPAYYNQAKWRGTWEFEGGGVLINQAIHTIDLLIWLLGEPDFVTASVSNLTLKDSIEVEDSATIIASGKSNFSILATNGNKFYIPPEITIKTDGEIIQILDDKVLIDGKEVKIDENKVFYGKPCYGMGHATIFDHYYDCVKNNIKFPIDGLEASKAVNFVLSCYESNGEKIKL